MSATVSAPLEADAQGILRISGTRVPLDSVLHEFLSGASPEEIVTCYPSVPLATMYTLVGHYLANRAELDEYLKANRAARNAAIEDGRKNQAGLRERLLAKVTSAEAGSAPVPR